MSRTSVPTRLPTRLMTVLACLVIAIGAGRTHGQTPSAQKADRELYNQLTARVKQIDRTYARTLEQAMKQARSGGGEADLETQAKLLSLQESRDRTMSRLLLVSTRHGWDVPDFNEPAEEQRHRAPGRSPAEMVFAPAARIVQARFAEEAMAIAAGLRLPVISLPPARGGAS